MALRSFAVRLSLVSLAAPAIAYAQFQCTSPPQQVSKDTSVAVQVAVGRLGPVKAGEFSTNVQNTTRDLLGSLPKGDRVYLEQMMFAAFCSSLQNDNFLSGREKTKALRDYAREVRQTLSPASSPVANPELRKEPTATTSLATDQLNAEQRYELIKLAQTGCYFFVPGEAITHSVTDYIKLAQKEFADSLTASEAAIVVQGYLETGYSKAYALKLSERRADAVKDILVARGLDSRRIYTEGHGMNHNQKWVREYFCGARISVVNK